MNVCVLFSVFFFKQKTAYEMRISDWSSDVCSSDLPGFLTDEDAHTRCRDAAFEQLQYLALAGEGLEQLAQAIDVRQVGHAHQQIGRASCRERVCQYV